MFLAGNWMALTTATYLLTVSSPTSGVIRTLETLDPAVAAVCYTVNDLAGVMPPGPEGPEGPAGADGAAGPPGNDGATGDQGIQGIQGIQGPPGDDGAQGIQGEQGEPGVGGFTFPVGYILISAVDTNPATFIGYGTWENVGAGRVLVGLDSGDADFDTAGETGGAKTVTLTAAQLPAHRHQILRERSATTGGATTLIARTSDTSSTADVNVFTENTGSGEAHPNVQPYLVVFYWQRTA